MTKGMREDFQLTLDVLNGRDPINADTTTWLRHATERDMPRGRKTDGQAGHIDLELLKGGLTVAQIATNVGVATGTICTESRVEDHFKHLEESPNGPMGPHHFKIDRDTAGRCSFNVEWIKTQVMALPQDQ